MGFIISLGVRSTVALLFGHDLSLLLDMFFSFDFLRFFFFLLWVIFFINMAYISVLIFKSNFKASEIKDHYASKNIKKQANK